MFKQTAFVTYFLFTVYLGFSECTPFTTIVPSGNSSFCMSNALVDSDTHYAYVTYAGFKGIRMPNVTRTLPLSLNEKENFITTELNNSSRVTSLEVFPIVISRFTGYHSDSKVQLEWVISSENNNDYFQIERLEDLEWHSISKQVGQMNALFEIHYSFTDYQPDPKNNKYRIKQVDLDGTYSYSEVIQVNISPKDEITIYPNPVRDRVSVKTSNSTKFQIVDTRGKVVLESNKSDGLDMSHLAEGVYFVLTFNEFEMIQSQTKVIKL